jgi:hypothetical protein
MKPIVDAITAVFGFIYDYVLKPIVDAITAVFGFIYDYVLKPIVDGLIFILTSIGQFFINCFNFIGCLISTLFNSIWGCIICPCTGCKVPDIECGGYEIAEKVGWMTKDWKNQYYFVLQNGSMKYYSAVAATKEYLVGKIPLKHFNLASKSLRLQANIIVLESLVEKDANVTLICYSPLHVEEWRSALQYNIRLAKSEGHSEVLDEIIIDEKGKSIEITEIKNITK